MRLGGRAQAAIEILDDIARRRRPAADALRDWGLSHRFAGGGDRSAIGSLVYDSLRKKRSQAWAMDSEEAGDAVFATLIGQWGYGVEELTAALEGDRFAPVLPPQELLRGFAGRELAEAPKAVRADIPDWCAPLFEQAFAENWIAEAAALAERPPLDMRANRLKASREKALARLAGHGAIEGPLSPDAMRIPPVQRDARLPNVQVEAEFQKGWFEIQDAGSQAAALLAGAGPGNQVLDLCAGGGGKTLALAAIMNNSGQIHAHDSDRNRLAPIYDRLRRAGVRNAQVHARPRDLEGLAGRMDLVLVDAPCTGTGTWRRRPDAKWRLDERNLEQRIAEQDAVLDQAASFVKPGGRLVYVTCSLLSPENGGRADDFLGRHPDFGEAPLAADALCNPAQHFEPGASRVTLSPLNAGCDGFFVAAFAKRE